MKGIYSLLVSLCVATVLINFADAGELKESCIITLYSIGIIVFKCAVLKCIDN